MKTPKKRRMAIYIILEIFENLGSQMAIYIYIYAHHPLYLVQAKGDFPCSRPDFLNLKKVLQHKYTFLDNFYRAE